jgi:O-methyltransferase domain/Dimerisation domain
MVARLLLRWRVLRSLVRARGIVSWGEVRPLLKLCLSRLWLRDRSGGGGTQEAGSRNGNLPPALFQMATGYWLSQAVYVAAKLGLADLLRNGPRSCQELAVVTGADPLCLFRLMRALSAARIFVRTQGDHFALASAGKSLQSDVPGSQRAIIMTLGEVHYQAWGNLLHSVRTGSTGFASTYGTSLFTYLQNSPEAADTFNRGMSDVASLLAYAVLLAYDFSRISFLVDVGGGHGQFLRTILQMHAEMKGTIFDLPSTIEQAKQYYSGDPCSGRIAAIGGDFFHFVPEGADAYVLCGVIHDWDDDPAVQILRNCRLAMNRKGRLLLVEVVVPEDDDHCFSKLLDLNMMVMTGGRERTRAEFAALLKTAGYSLSRIIPTLAPQSVLEAIPS